MTDVHLRTERGLTSALPVETLLLQSARCVESIAFCLSGNLFASALDLLPLRRAEVESIVTNSGTEAGTRSAAPELGLVVPPQPAECQRGDGEQSGEL